MSELDPKTGLEILRKQPTTDAVRNMDFTAVMGTATISSISSAVAVNQGVISGSSDVTIGTTSIDGLLVQLPLSGGTHGEDYLITVKIVDSNTEDQEGDGILQVRENVR
jgi:hypothetical protein